MSDNDSKTGSNDAIDWPSLDFEPDEVPPLAASVVNAALTDDGPEPLRVMEALPGAASASGVTHLVVLGDAIAELMSLREQGPNRVEHLLLPQQTTPWKLTLLTVEEIGAAGALFQLPADASHVMISVEGNRAIADSGLLDNQPDTFQDALVMLSVAADEYERQVEILIQVAKASRLPTVVTTMYPPFYEDPMRQRAAMTALAVFNDRLVRRVFAAKLPLVDLSLVCTDEDDYADELRLSKRGLRKASNVVMSALYAVARDPSRADIFF